MRHTAATTLPPARSRPRAAGLTLALFLLATGALQAALQVSVKPEVLLVGETGQLQLVSDQDTPRAVELPKVDGLEWLAGPQVSTQVRIVNFRRSVTASATYLFRVRAKGTYTIPPFAVQVAGKRDTTPQLTIRAEDGRAELPAAGGTVDLEQAFFITATMGDGGTAAPRQLWVGQELLLEVQAWVLEPLFHGLGYPDIRAENLSFIEDAQANPENPRFEPPAARREIRDGHPYKVVTFRCRLAPLAAGTLRGEVTVPAQLVLSERRRTRPTNDPFAGFDDGLLDDMFATRQVLARQATAALPELPIQPLPAPPPEAGPFLGLTGAWEQELAVTPEAIPLGEPATLTLEVRGRGGLAGLAPPRLNLTGFRAFDPEVRRAQAGQAGRATVTWVVVALFPDAQLPELRFCTFDPVAGQYRSARFTPQLQVLPAQGRTAASVVVDAGAGGTRPATRPAHQATDILYVKTTPGPGVLRPLWRNHLAATLLLGAGGPLLLGACAWAAGRRERLHGSLSYRRRLAALRERQRLLRELARCPPAERGTLVRERLVPCLAALGDLPPGTTAEALAARLEHAPAVAAALRAAAADGFRPGSGTAATDVPTRDLVRALRRLALAVPLLLLPWPSASAQAIAPAAPAGGIEAATRAYDAGDVATAARLYADLEKPGSEAPHLLYNRANCAFRLGHLGEALALYERARRLAPRDSDVLENLNFVRGRLGLPPVGDMETPRELALRLRDTLRPDEWLLLAAAALCAGCALAAWRRWRRLPVWPALAAAAGLAFLCGLALWSQCQDTYAHDRHAIVLREGTLARRLPAADAEAADLALREGEPVLVTELRSEWLRVRSGDAEAWVPRDGVGFVW